MGIRLKEILVRMGVLIFLWLLYRHLTLTVFAWDLALNGVTHASLTHTTHTDDGTYSPSCTEIWDKNGIQGGQN